MVLLLIEPYLIAPLSVTLTILQGHDYVEQFTEQVVFLSNQVETFLDCYVSHADIENTTIFEVLYIFKGYNLRVFCFDQNNTTHTHTKPNNL